MSNGSAIATECVVLAIASIAGVVLLLAIASGPLSSNPSSESVAAALSQSVAIIYWPVGVLVAAVLGMLPGKGFAVGALWAFITIPVQNVLTWVLVRYLIERWRHRHANEI